MRHDGTTPEARSGTFGDEEGMAGPGDFIWRPEGNRHKAFSPDLNIQMSWKSFIRMLARPSSTIAWHFSATTVSRPFEHKALGDGLAGTVRNIHALWLEQRQKQMAAGTLPSVVRREPVRNPTKVGRNEPCPRGSGKKYKQCHGGADNS